MQKNQSSKPQREYCFPNWPVWSEVGQFEFFLLCHGSRKFKLPATGWCDGLRTAVGLRYDYKRVFAEEDVISYPLPT